MDTSIINLVGVATGRMTCAGGRGVVLVAQGDRPRASSLSSLMMGEGGLYGCHFDGPGRRGLRLGCCLVVTAEGVA
jgi:hypothetical protein